MATWRLSILGNERLDSGVGYGLVSTQITAATSPSVGDVPCYVLNDGGADEGLKISFSIPKNFVSAPKLVIRGILDGTPGASDVLGFGFRKRAVANNEAADGTFDAEQTSSATIGSGGSGHADEDALEQSITLTAGDYAVDDQVYGYVYIDASSTTYTGNFLLTDVQFEFADA
jgi:hypothetical protein